MPRCDDCRTPMTQGYVIDAGALHYCEPCHTKHYTPEQWAEMYFDGETDNYWTEWEEGDDTPEDGERIQYATKGPPESVTCPYCEGCGEGTYWVHSLESTISTTCHGCDGTGEVSRERAKDLESDTKSL